jgi:hypothetical protein
MGGHSPAAASGASTNARTAAIVFGERVDITTPASRTKPDHCVFSLPGHEPSHVGDDGHY